MLASNLLAVLLADPYFKSLVYSKMYDLRLKKAGMHANCGVL
nr:hypothetical protein [uncultured Cohaesibacter sp.]